MSYSATYVDEKGRSHTITIRDDESQEALRNDYQASRLKDAKRKQERNCIYGSR